MNVVDSIGNENDLVIDIKEEIDYLEKIKYYLKDKNIEDEIVVYNPFEKEDFIIVMKMEIPKLKIFMYCSDDEWRCFNYDRYLALYVDFFSITAKVHLPLYKKWGFENAIGTNWACNTKKFYPLNIEKKYDVTFIGAAYGQRIEYVKEAIKNNINIKVFGKGWDKFSDIKPYWGGYVSSEDINKIINQSKINLNFMWSSKGGYQVKGRNFELSGCKVFQLCNYGEELLEYFKPDINIGTFKDKNDFIEKINYYLANEKEREEIAKKSYELTLQKHTWDRKFKEIFKFGQNKNKIASLPKFKILVLNENNVEHNIKTNDSRLDIYFEDIQKEYDGVIRLQNNTTINNETLYMMAFALYADKSDVVFANFYIDDIWIRFRDHKIEKKKNLLSLLPRESIMFAKKERIDTNINNLKSHSFIEYPTFGYQNIGLLQKIPLRLLFSSYHQNEAFAKYKKNKNIVGMLTIAMEYFARKLILR
jgi:glycosyltransferase involved in cell wall biosynthesis